MFYPGRFALPNHSLFCRTQQLFQIFIRSSFDTFSACAENTQDRIRVMHRSYLDNFHAVLRFSGLTLLCSAKPESFPFNFPILWEMLLKKSWKNKTFRRFNIQSEIPRIYPGRRHFVNEAINYIRKIWLELGFKEMTGNLVQTSFWNFDALFVPQDHPAREMQDTFFINGKGKLPNSEIVKRVKAVHENGWTTGSSGWNYKWSEEEAKKLVLRTHTTVLSARTIAALRKEELPAKFFSVGKIFRNEAIDWAHLFELHQIEGIIIDESVNFKNLLGYLREYYNKLGIDKVKFRPSYYPYTEMSVDCIAYIPERNKF